MSKSHEQIAREFLDHYEISWNAGAVAKLADLYTPDAIVVGYVTAVGREQISQLLRRIIEQGWTRITIKLTAVRQVGGVILMANQYRASGSGERAGETLEAQSTHVLTCVDALWLSAMHTAT